MLKREKLFVGEKVRRLRQQNGLQLQACAAALDISPGYLSQIETNQRPVTARVLVDLIRLFNVDAAVFDAGDSRRVLADLREATLDLAEAASPVPLDEVRQVATSTPAFARQFLALHRSYRRLQQRLAAMDETLGLDETGAKSALLPYEEVRDYFHYRDNYIHALDVAGETLAAELAPGAMPEQAFEAALRDRFGVRIARALDAAGVLRKFDAADRVVTLDAAQPASTRAFQLAYQLASLAFGELIESELAQARLASAEARDVCRVGLTNYAAGALMMPYRSFREAARDMRHDLERLQLRFQASLEQVCHRLSNLQRPGQRGTPFYFVRVDMAGNITKRHSATRLQFARFGGACALWNVHEAFGRLGETLVQIAETPDGVRHLCVAIGVVKRGGAHHEPLRRYALGLGCEIEHADQVVYADGLDLGGRAVPVGISCRICERGDCAQRAFPALDRSLQVPEGVREVVPYRLVDRPPDRRS